MTYFEQFFDWYIIFQICSDDPALGRYIIATRDLKPGELLLAESPLVVAPMAVTPPVCLVCYKPVDGRNKWVPWNIIIQGMDFFNPNLHGGGGLWPPPSV